MKTPMDKGTEYHIYTVLLLSLVAVIVIIGIVVVS